MQLADGAIAAVTSGQSTLGSIDTALEHAGRLLASRPQLALEQAAEILRVAPSHVQARLLKGRAELACGRLQEARTTLQALAGERPVSGAIAVELGRLLARLGEALRREGDPVGAGQVYLAAIEASTSDPVLQQAALALADGQLPVAERLLRTRLKERPNDVAAMRMFAELAGRIGRYRDAVSLLERALELAPGFDAARHNLALALHRQGRGREALATLEPLLQAEPGNPSFGNLKAAILTRMGDHEAACAQYRDVLRRFPEQPKVWLSLGHVLKTLGDQAESIAAYRRAIALQPTLGEAWWSLANLKTLRFSDADVAAMRQALQRPGLDGEDRFHLEFALGKAEEDAAHPEAAFAHYLAANRGRRAVIDFDSDRFSATVTANRRLYTAAFFAEREGFGCLAPDPIFVVSLPRAGSTLIEQILSSHSAIEGTAELQDVGAMVARLTADEIAALGPDDAYRLGEQYLEQTRVHRKTGRPLFIDKMPNNWLHVGFIRLILPRATVIDARRHPLACCWSNFKQHFARGQAFTYDLTEIARYYRDYALWMAHVDAVLPGHVQRVFYEQMVDDQDGQTRILLQRLGLPFEEACRNFHETRRAVSTASSEQVRRPIFRDGLEQWKPYERWLAPMRAVLGEIASRYPEMPRLD